VRDIFTLKETTAQSVRPYTSAGTITFMAKHFTAHKPKAILLAAMNAPENGNTINHRILSDMKYWMKQQWYGQWTRNFKK
jgi:hypothetical protein